MVKLIFKFLIIFFKKKLLNYFKFFFFKRGYIYILTNFNYFYNIIFFLNKSSFFQFKILIDVIVSDYPEKFYRFLISYSLLSIKFNLRLNLIFCFKELFPIISIKRLFYSSNWLEREIWDFYGIFFIFNNDLKRLFLDYGFEGYPLRKDFPLYGYLEIFYNQPSNSLFYTQVQINKD